MYVYLHVYVLCTFCLPVTRARNFQSPTTTGKFRGTHTAQSLSYNRRDQSLEQGRRKQNVSGTTLRDGGRARAIVIGRESSYKVPQTSKRHCWNGRTNTQCRILRFKEHCFGTKRRYGHGRTGCHGSDAPAGVKLRWGRSLLSV